MVAAQAGAKREAAVIARALEQTYGMQIERRMLASGTPFKVPQEWLYVIDVSPYQDLKDIMDGFVEQTQLNAVLGVPARIAGATERVRDFTAPAFCRSTRPPENR